MHAGSCVCEKLCVLVLQEVAIGLAVLGAALPAEGNHDTLLGAYVTLCSDKVWAVRKACADILPEIAKLAKAEMRETQLLPVFDKFCEDVSHWVQTSALQQLGPFISTLEAHHIPQSESDLRLMASVCSKYTQAKLVSPYTLLARVLEAVFDCLNDTTAVTCLSALLVATKGQSHCSKGCGWDSPQAGCNSVSF